MGVGRCGGPVRLHWPDVLAIEPVGLPTVCGVRGDRGAALRGSRGRWEARGEIRKVQVFGECPASVSGEERVGPLRTFGLGLAVVGHCP